MMKKFNIYSLLTAVSILLVISLGACKKDYKNGGTKVEKLAGEYWVQLDDGTGFSDGYYSFNLYNTAANNDSLWVDDNESVLGLKGRVLSNPSALTFSITNTPCLYDDGITTFTLTDGKVVPNGTTASGTGDKADAISFTLTYDTTDKGVVTHNTVKAKGYRRTGFAQDDH
ncbi:hypothetical protein FO440_03485 [Mucilaginibacter corticis]|uniref:Uncharacterized protein n=1 Tax=Mucilaginibacter corticis TaxID=2597670 RepID=A0A556MTQ5_9SPHI|nr:lipid-binding protein [Mucilaginibacter corticis]TSJ43267.1 hypothetical protein FO440_03485 [Mucilaginibacter corticis]